MKKENNIDSNKNNIINFPDNENSSKKSGCLVILLVALFAVILVISSVDKNSNFSSTSTVNESAISLANTNNYDIAKYLDGFIIARDGRIECYNTAHQIQWELSSSKTLPTITTNGKYALIYYPEDKLAVVTNGKKTKRIKTTGNVTYGYVNSKGYTVLSIKESGLKNKIAVYDRNGDLIYYRDNPDKQIPYAILSDNNKSLVTIELLLEDNHISSELVVTNVKNNSNTSTVKFDDAIPGQCVFSTKDRILLVFDTKMLCYSLRGNLKWKKSFENHQVSKASYNDGVFAFVFEETDVNTHGNTVAFYNKRGDKAGEFFTEERINSIDVCDNNALITSGRKISLINAKGKILSETDITFDLKETMLINTKNSALALSGSEEIRLFRLR